MRYFLRQRHPDIKAFMAQNGWGNEFGKLVDYYFQRLISVTQDVTQQKMQYIVWQEGILKLPFFKY